MNRLNLSILGILSIGIMSAALPSHNDGDSGRNPFNPDVLDGMRRAFPMHDFEIDLVQTAIEHPSQDVRNRCAELCSALYQFELARPAPDPRDFRDDEPPGTVPQSGEIPAPSIPPFPKDPPAEQGVPASLIDPFQSPGVAAGEGQAPAVVPAVRPPVVF